MTEAKGQNEPSMEEILASIRRIIAEDGEPPAPGQAPAPAAAKPAQEEKPASAAQEEILDLTEVVAPEASPPEAPHDERRAAPQDEPPRAPEPEPEQEPRARVQPEPEPTVPAAASSDSSIERLVSPATAAASVAALSQLNTLGERRGADIPLGASHRTLEELVREMLKPMLRDWLDENLPDLVERLVREEITLMVREARSR